MRDKLYISIIIIFFAVSLRAEQFTFVSSRSDALGGTSVLSSPLPSEQLTTGAVMNSKEKFNIDFGFKRQYNLKELDLLYSAFSYSLKNFNFVTGFSQLGDPEIYALKQIRIGMLVSQTKFSFGGYYSYLTHDFYNHYRPLHRSIFGLSIQYRHKNFIISSLIDNINKPQFTDTSPSVEPKLSIYGQILSDSKYTTTVRYVRQKENKDIFGIGESVLISKSATLLFGFSTEPVTFGAGIEFSFKNQKVIYNTKYHPVLGLSHTISFSFKLLDN